MTESLVLVEQRDGVAVVTLNRPEAMNALSRALIAEYETAFDRLARDPSCDVIILTGAGRAFCAGLDLKELGGEAGDAGGPEPARGLVEPILACAQPVIAAINGPAVTGGFELALACDILIASTAARFADTHARVGILPGAGLSQRLPRLIGISRAKELSLTGNYLSAETALAWGLVNRVVAPEELLLQCLALAQDMGSCLPSALRAVKRMIDEGYGMTFREALTMEDAVSRARRGDVTEAEIAARRRGIQERGRQQAAGAHAATGSGPA
jgi:enoyl-CoA hydratase